MYSSRSYFIYRIKNIFLSIIFPCFINSAFYLESTNNTWTGSSFLLLSSLGLFNFFFFLNFSLFCLFILITYHFLYFQKVLFSFISLAMWPSFLWYFIFFFMSLPEFAKWMFYLFLLPDHSFPKYLYPFLMCLFF